MLSIKHTFVSFLSIVAITSVMTTGCAAETDDEELAGTTSLNKKGGGGGGGNNNNGNNNNNNKPAPAPAPAVEAGVIPQDCLGYFEREANNTKPDHFRGSMMCGEVTPGDVDKFEFDMKDDNGAYTVILNAPAGAYLELKSSCAPDQKVWGTFAQLKLNPRKDCTAHVNITSETKQIYRLYRLK